MAGPLIAEETADRKGREQNCVTAQSSFSCTQRKMVSISLSLSHTLTHTHTMAEFVYLVQKGLRYACTSYRQLPVHFL